MGESATGESATGESATGESAPWERVLTAVDKLTSRISDVETNLAKQTPGAEGATSTDPYVHRYYVCSKCYQEDNAHPGKDCPAVRSTRLQTTATGDPDSNS